MRIVSIENLLNCKKIIKQKIPEKDFSKILVLRCFLWYNKRKKTEVLTYDPHYEYKTERGIG